MEIIAILERRSQWEAAKNDFLGLNFTYFERSNGRNIAQEAFCRILPLDMYIYPRHEKTR